MQASSYRVEDLVPHRGRMVLIDEVVSFDEGGRALVAAFAARREWSENWAAVEYMAQAAAALAGIVDRLGGYDGPPKPGFLLGTRRLELALERFEPGRRYLVRAANVFSDAESASFECEITDESGASLARATINAYRPSDTAPLRENLV